MKNKKSIFAVVLLGMLHAFAANASVQDEGFTPLEQLSPQARQALAQQVNALMQTAQIDWETVAVGVNDEGKLVIRSKDKVMLQQVSSPSTWGR